MARDRTRAGGLAQADPGVGAARPPAPGPAGPPLGRRLGSLVRLMRLRVVRLVFLALVLALLALALLDQGGTLWHEVQRLSAPVVRSRSSSTSAA